MSSELKVFTLPLKTNIFGRVIVSQSYYGKSAVDAVISEKDRALEFAKALTLKDIKTIEEKDKEIAELKAQIESEKASRHAEGVAQKLRSAEKHRGGFVRKSSSGGKT